MCNRLPGYCAIPSRLAIGTAQFGLPYGIANKSGQVVPDEIARILAAGRACEVDTLDTAVGYGESERRLGEAGVAEWRVVTKLPAVPDGCRNPAAWVRASVGESIARLKVRRLHGLLLHRPGQLLGDRGHAIYEAMSSLKAEGVVSRIGVSVYAPAELEPLTASYQLDLVQAPFNVMDRRLVTSGWLARLRDADVEVHARSAFLQGLLVIPRRDRPPKFGRWRAMFDRWDEWLADQRGHPVEVCLAFVLGAPVDRVVVGVDSAAQLRQLLAAEGASFDVPGWLSSEDETLINPAKWNQL